MLTILFIALYLIAGVAVTIAAIKILGDGMIDNVEAGLLTLVWPILIIFGCLSVLGRLIKFLTRMTE